MTKNNRLSGMVMLLTVAAIALAGCSGRETPMPSGNGSDYRQIALEFTQFLAAREYPKAYALTSQEYRLRTSAEQLQAHFETIVPTDWGQGVFPFAQQQLVGHARRDDAGADAPEMCAATRAVRMVVGNDDLADRLGGELADLRTAQRGAAADAAVRHRYAGASLLRAPAHRRGRHSRLCGEGRDHRHAASGDDRRGGARQKPASPERDALHHVDGAQGIPHPDGVQVAPFAPRSAIGGFPAVFSRGRVTRHFGQPGRETCATK